MIYNKNPKNNDKFEHNLPNVGFDTIAYLRYIVEYYDNLPDYVCFSQDYPFDHCPSFVEKVNNFNFESEFYPLGCTYVRTGDELEKTLVYANKNEIFYEEPIKFISSAQCIVSKNLILKNDLEYYIKIMNIHFLLGILFSLAGLLIALYLLRKKKALERPFCPLRADCHRVIQSQYSSMFGVPLEYFGIGYYLLSALLYVTPILFPFLDIVIIKTILITISVVGAIFSLYLISLQAFVIKSWCSWCFLSAIISVVLFIISFTSITPEVVVTIGFFKRFLVIVHVLAVVVGMGSAFITDRLFFRFLKDYRISPEEKNIMDDVSKVIWVALFIIFVSGFLIYITNMGGYNSTPRFWVKMLGVLIITINGIFLNVVISPKLISINFLDEIPFSRDVSKKRKLAFALGSISLSSRINADDNCSLSSSCSIFSGPPHP
jgi:uncharacterized membrane protein